MDVSHEVRLGDFNDALRISGLSRSEIWRRVSAGAFPQPVRLGPRCTRWPLHEIEQWVKDQLAARESAAEGSHARRERMSKKLRRSMVPA